MKRRSSAHQVSFTHITTSYFNSKANGDKKSVSKNKPKKTTKNKAPCNKLSSQLLQKKAPYTSSKKTLNTRGGVEDTRLEAKAKDAKKIRGQGQGQPFRGQNLSRPRTGMLEAKAKDQGHRRKCSPKKKSSKIFFRRSPIRWRTQNLLG